MKLELLKSRVTARRLVAATAVVLSLTSNGAWGQTATGGYFDGRKPENSQMQQNLQNANQDVTSTSPSDTDRTSARVIAETSALAKAIAAVLNNSTGKTAAQLRREIGVLIADPAYQFANVQLAFNTAKTLARPKITTGSRTFYVEALKAVTEVEKSINFALSTQTGTAGGTGRNTGGAAISNTTIGGAVATGGHS